MSEIECAELHSELFRRRHSTRQSHGLFALAKHLLTFGRSGAQSWASKHQNVENFKNGLDQYGAARFKQQQFGTAGVEGVKLRTFSGSSASIPYFG